MKYIFINLLLFFNITNAEEKSKFNLISTQARWIEEERIRNVKTVEELREFEVGEKYCLFETENWDDECQDGAMEYAFGENWRECKKVALDFVKYTREMDIENLITLFSPDYLYIDIPIFHGPNYIPGLGRYHERAFADYYYNIDEYRQNLSGYFKYWNQALKGVKYKDFLLVSSKDSTDYSLEISRYMTIHLKLVNKKPKIYSIEYY
jgi:hypothetical protein